MQMNHKETSVNVVLVGEFGSFLGTTHLVLFQNEEEYTLRSERTIILP